MKLFEILRGKKLKRRCPKCEWFIKADTEDQLAALMRIHDHLVHGSGPCPFVRPAA